ncbi:MAG: hypothetical protein AVDCRST_MAG34-2398 [uncultured Nocardioidaceae bacterium]|uniref:Uncharacterized protein n=1 Tax=uncultured Nocardioidaceae bacterium TaxID=253824 RepID=A0A6J4ML41_9ACTN|nr:MAG: hypothetical protein AVDCRST_MAG34-2398 [uncultured Nocardioidaceae bacterium]
MPLRRTAVLALIFAAFVLTASPALAQRATVTDPAGDASGPGLDVVSATVRNRDHAIVARVRFDRAVRGDLIVSVDPRGDRGVRLVSEYRPHRTTRNYVVGGAFTRRVEGELRCGGFRVVWIADAEVARMRLPSRCLQDGNYGAVRFAVLTERGGDTDYAPETADGDIGVSGWIPRG